MSTSNDLQPRCPLTRYSLQEVFGGNAVSDEYGIGRHVANLFVTQTYEGQSDIHGEKTLAIAHVFFMLTLSSINSGSCDYGHAGILLIVWYRCMGTLAFCKICRQAARLLFPCSRLV